MIYFGEVAETSTQRSKRGLRSSLTDIPGIECRSPQAAGAESVNEGFHSGCVHAFRSIEGVAKALQVEITRICPPICRARVYGTSHSFQAFTHLAFTRGLRIGLNPSSHDADGSCGGFSLWTWLPAADQALHDIYFAAHELS